MNEKLLFKQGNNALYIGGLSFYLLNEQSLMKEINALLQESSRFVPSEEATVLSRRQVYQGG